MEKDSTVPSIPPGSFVQYSADNVDHNSCTLDGKDTFHGMGVIACVTPPLQLSSTPIKRITSRKPLPAISSSKGIPIVGYFGKEVEVSAL